MASKKNVPLGELRDVIDYLDESSGNWNVMHSDLLDAMEDGLDWLKEARKTWAEMKGVFIDYGGVDRLAGVFYDKLVECVEVTEEESDMSAGDWDELFDGYGALEKKFVVECKAMKMRLSRAGIPVR